MQPRTRYADSSGYSIAYQVLGEGPTDVLLVQGLISHLDLQWCDPVFANFLYSIAAHCRLILMDQRGVGLSDGPGFVASVEERAGDIHAVLEAVGSQHTVVVGHCHGGPPAAVYTAANPHRVAGLVLMSTFATGVADPDSPEVISDAEFTRWLDVVEHWGEGRSLSYFNPSRSEGAIYRHMYATFERAALTRGMARSAVASTREIDVTNALTAVRAPTLVLHSQYDFMPVAAGRRLAAAIPGARFVELEGSDHVPFVGVGSPEVADAILEFIGTAPQSGDGSRQRFGAVVMTDIVHSTESTIQAGDEVWADIMVRHDAHVRDAIDRRNGECIKFTGDGYLAVFTTCEDALHCAENLRRIASEHGLTLRCGVHAGRYEPVGNDAVGLTVITAARLMAAAGAGRILASEAVMRAVAGGGIRFGSPRGLALKGIASAVMAAEVLSVSAQENRWYPQTGGPEPALSWQDRWIIFCARQFPEIAHPFSRTWRHRLRPTQRYPQVSGSKAR
ncbi:adenylate/guanylate cyclase domain-containing protein [Mycolicibacterium mageritense]|uniref:adenylate/guanylate cyclase domain-containing protein n=1 Tax=Mycolicibacterium mageritense TaxID=53462 RepID=UPI0011DB53C2|nr:adenylate/guanylate cyclase domain-containing protein [Mycolicibacterium mageritense]TXI57912.1 MAG: adenylate/guanylate cyclase domain-containing protein [Mycolicibacterium mageritense]